MTECDVCGCPTDNHATKRCNSCWEVERRLQDYLRHPNGRVLAQRLIDQYQVNLTIDEAKQIISAFGSCTHMYECTEPHEMVEHARLHAGDLESFIRLELEVEGIKWERCEDARGAGGVLEANEIEERKEWMASVANRVWETYQMIGVRRAENV